MKIQLFTLGALIGLVAIVLGGVLPSGPNDAYFGNARAGVCTPCTTLNTQRCLDLNNKCGTYDTEDKCTGSCTTCSNEYGAYTYATSCKDPKSGTEPDGQFDCGNQVDNATCTWMFEVCVCRDGTDSKKPGDCGKKDKYKTCTPP